MKKLKLFFKNNWFYVLIFVLFFGLCFLFPYTGDDWAWGSRIGLERLETWFKDYNGRYAGNLLVLLITRSVIVRSFVESICFTFIVYLMNKIINKKNNLLGIFIVFLLCLMPMDIFRQSVVWASGFSNYVPPILLFLVYIYCNSYLFEDKIINKKKSIFVLFLYLILGFVGALFIENITIYIFILGGFVCLYELFRTKKISLHNIFYFIGVLLGTGLMFSNGAYQMVGAGEDTYRTIDNSNKIINCIKVYMNELDRYIFYNNFIIFIILSVVILFFLYKIIKNNKNKLVVFFSYLFAFCTCLFLTNNLFLKLYTTPISRKFLSNSLNAGLTFLLVFALIFVFIKGVKKAPVRRKLFLYLGSMVITNLPLLIVTPIGPRLFLSNYIFIVLITVELLETLNLKDLVIYNIIKLGIISIFGFYIVIFLQIYHVQLVTEKYIEENRDKQFLMLPNLPFTDYLHVANPNNNRVFNYRYKLFYGIDEKVIVKFENYKDWKKNQKTASN